MIRKIRLVSKFMTSQPGKQTIAVHALPSISRNKGNQTMKFGQLIEHNMRNIILVKSYTKCGGKTTSRLVSGKLKLSLSLDQKPKVLYSFFLVYPKLRVIEIY